ncbi:dihydrolipoyl dehydrogenase [Billgrantia sp. LNSP4103-1]|uniref:dihydrolipoyl dehydrogenase n=1 Tax=Billgrantia sp. LNSP4103-1 TaxID=3410266 RepID=UPI00403F8F9B
MQARDVDIAIIGAGTAGLSAWQTARQYSDSVVLIEGGEPGTTCARVGCMPSKLLIAAADSAHHAREAAGFGITTGPVEINGGEVMARVRRQRDAFVENVLESMQRIEPHNCIEGYARFEAPHTLRIGNDLRLHARAIVIATGSRPHWPDALAPAGDRLLDSDAVFDWQDLPDSVAVFGAGSVGLELGQALARLGVRLRLFGKSGSLGPFKETALRKYAERTFNETFYLDSSAQVEDIARNGAQVVITFIERGSGRRLTERFDYLLAATGRRPNIDRLDLENAGLALDDKGMPHYNRFTMQCRGNSDQGEAGHIFIAGDSSQELPLLHEANQQGRIAGHNAGRYPERRAGRRSTPLTIAFTDPQMATVGLSRDEAASRFGCDNVAEGGACFEDQGRAVVMRQNRGLVRLYAEHGSGLFLGAELFGPQMEHIAHLLAWALEQKMGVERMLEMPFYHPVLEEGLRSALRDLSSALLQGPAMTERCMEYGPGG